MNNRRSGNPYIKLPNPPSKGPSLFSIIVSFLISRGFGAIMTFFRLRGEWKRKNHDDYSMYASIIGSRVTVSITELASKSGKTTSSVIYDLQAMINKGYIRSGAYIDRKSMLLVLDPTVFETVFTDSDKHASASEQHGSRTETVFVDPKHAKTAAPAGSTVPKKPAAAKSKPEPVYNFTGSEEYAEKLRQLRQLDIEIQDEAVSMRIDRIGHLTASIFKVVEEHPERAEEVRKFMNYYLPTTFKLLRSYSLMEKQSFQGDNIAESRKKIEAILDTLVHAYETQLDRLFKAEALDVDTDISVLETMMASDGLIEPALTLKPGPKGNKAE